MNLGGGVLLSRGAEVALLLPHGPRETTDLLSDCRFLKSPAPTSVTSDIFPAKSFPLRILGFLALQSGPSDISLRSR